MFKGISKISCKAQSQPQYTQVKKQRPEREIAHRIIVVRQPLRTSTFQRRRHPSSPLKIHYPLRSDYQRINLEHRVDTIAPHKTWCLQTISSLP